MVMIYQVGPHSMEGYDLAEVTDDRYEWLVYSYEQDSYEGSGEAVALGKDGLLYCRNLGHCSCYGPMDSWATSFSKVTVEEFMKPKESIFDDIYKDAVVKKVCELLPWVVPLGPVFADKFDLLDSIKDE